MKKYEEKHGGWGEPTCLRVGTHRQTHRQTNTHRQIKPTSLLDTPALTRKGKEIRERHHLTHTMLKVVPSSEVKTWEL